MSTPAGVTAIADADDHRVDDYRRLNDQAERNALEGDEFFIAEGFLAIDRLIESGHQLRSLLVATRHVERVQPYLGRPALAGVPVYSAGRDTMRDIVGFDLHRGVVASGQRKPMTPLTDIAATARRVVVLEGLNDNENVGAIARAARAFAVDALVLSPNCTDPYYRRTVRVSMGEVLGLTLCQTSDEEWPGALRTLNDAGFVTWAMTPGSDAVDLWAQPIPERVAVVLGAEGPGLTEATMCAATHRVRIPIAAEVDSLNVGHAAAVTLAALTRPT